MSATEPCAAKVAPYDQMRQSRRMLDFARLSLGLSLVQLEETGSWRGVSGASTFHRFLVTEGLDPRVVRPYMAVASKYVLELGLQPDSIVGYGISALNMFADIVTKTNAADIFGALDSMPAQEAKAFIQSVYGPAITGASHQIPSTIQKVLTHVDSLTLDERRSLLQTLSPR